MQDKLATMMAKKESILKEKEDAESVSRAKVRLFIIEEPQEIFTAINVVF